jgi:hypothetical protein
MRRRARLTVLTVTATLFVAVAMVASGASAQEAKQSVSSAGAADTTPFFTWSTTIGHGANVTISTHGNIIQYESPFGYEHFGVGSLSEGYVLCYTDPSATPQNVYDLGGFEFGFGPSTNTTSPQVTVSRDTADGVLNFHQRFNADLGADRFSITMRVTNISRVTIHNILLRRQADIDTDTGGAMGWANFLNWFARSEMDGVMAWNDEARADSLGEEFEAHELVLGHRIASVTRDAQVTENILDPNCNPAEVAGSESGPVGPADYGASLAYNVGSLGPGAQRTIVIMYVED